MKKIILFLVCLSASVLVKSQLLIPFNGSGTITDPFQIGSLNELRYLSENSTLWNFDYLQTSDIDASETSSWNNGAGMATIGNGISIFTGTYDGGGHVVKNIFISRPDANFVGLFGYTDKAVIQNLGTINVNIKGKNIVGGLVALNQSVIKNCFSTGSVSGILNVGGLVGRNDNVSELANSYSRCNVEGTRQVGGLIGYSYGEAAVENCYSTGAVSGFGSFFGGLIGQDYSVYDPINCLWDTESSGKKTSDGGIGLSSAEMKSRLPFLNSGWDFKCETENGSDDIWNIGSDRNDGYPYLDWQFPYDMCYAYIDVFDIDSITAKTAVSGCEIFYDGGTVVNEKGVCWSTSPFPTVNDSFSSNKNAADTTGVLVSVLKNNTLYFVRAYAKNSAGISYSRQISLNTLKLDGSGTLTDPYVISDINDLINLSADTLFWDDHFIQTANIDASETSGWNDSTGWMPIGNALKKFSGVYNGNGHVVSGLYISRPNSDYQGFFGWTSKAVIKNLGIEDFNFEGFNFVAGLTSFNESDVSYCFASGNASGNDYVGILLGMNYNYSSVSNCYSIGSSTGRNQVGGLIGSNFSKTITEYCYSVGTVSGTTGVGGFMGNNTSNVVASFWSAQVNGLVTSKVGIEKSEEEMQLRSVFLGFDWDFKGETVKGTDEIWNIGNGRNNGLPYLNWQYDSDPTMAYLSTIPADSITISTAISGGEITSDGGAEITERGICLSRSIMPSIDDTITSDGNGTGSYISFFYRLERNTTYYMRAYAVNVAGISYGDQISFTTKLLDGSGTDEIPYEIATIGDLKALSENTALWNKIFIQTSDIDATETSGWNKGEGWISVGNSIDKFSGTYNGGGHIINGLYINRPESSYLGLFGWTNNATIKNLGLNDLDFNGNYGIGGISGNNYNSSIRMCFTSGNIKGTSNVGGLVGRNYTSKIENCYSLVNVSGSDNIGGLVGSNNKESVIDKSFSNGRVEGITNTGGLAGSNNAYVQNSFWDKETSMQIASSGGIGIAAKEMKYRPEYINQEWDFKGNADTLCLDIWNINDNRNNGYPYFDWQFPEDDFVTNIIISTLEAFEIVTDSAMTGGEIFSDGGSEVIEKGICYSLDTMPTLLDFVLTVENGEDPFEVLITGLKDSTTYYVRAFAKNLAGVSYGEQVKFTTKKIKEEPLVDNVKINRSSNFKIYSFENNIVVEGLSDEDYKVTVCNYAGQHIFNGKMNDANNKIKIDIRGIYVMLITNFHGEYFVEKVIIK